MATVETRNPKSSTCPRCFGTVEVTRIEVACPDCGLVLDPDPVDWSKEWRGIDDEGESRERVAPVDRDRSDKGLGSDLGYHSERDRAFERRAKWHYHACHSHKDRNRDYATSEVRRIGVGVGLPAPVIDSACHLFRRLHRTDACDGQDLDEITAACVLAACRLDRQGRVAAELAPLARCGEHRIQRTYRVVIRSLGLEVPPPDIEQRIRVVGAKLPVDRRAVERACERLRSVADREGTSGGVSTLAAWCLYEESGLTQHEVADAATCTATGLRKRGKRLKDGRI